MFETLTPRPQDAIMALMEMCKADNNPNKIGALGARGRDEDLYWNGWE